ncbi:hypothetical protein Ccrd_003890 [Cynara cardunculus var. scolymus]|uniref:Uncharacterized protein n=1 Tax=Cynara cardunculus var. scolymus TaxID=59895 RepID=A0A103XNF4_CYNCS|nr:hypothetical protein Ccrd_003890 [Cynara cardunculus var. scolymus]
MVTNERKGEEIQSTEGSQGSNLLLTAKSYDPNKKLLSLQVSTEKYFFNIRKSLVEFDEVLEVDIRGILCTSSLSENRKIKARHTFLKSMPFSCTRLPPSCFGIEQIIGKDRNY